MVQTRDLYTDKYMSLEKRKHKCGENKNLQYLQSHKNTCKTVASSCSGADETGIAFITIEMHLILNKLFAVISARTNVCNAMN